MKHESNESDSAETCEQVLREWTLSVPSLGLLVCRGEMARIAFANLAIADLFGYARDRVLGSSFWDWIHPEDVASVRDAYRHAMDSGVTATVERRIGSSNSDATWVELTIDSVQRNQGSACFGVIRVRDVTSKRQSHEAIALNRERLEDAVRIAKIAHWVFDFKTSQCSWSPERFELFGLDSASYVPTCQKFFALLHPDDVAVVEAEIQSVIDGSDEFACDSRVQTPGGIKWIHTIARVVRDSEGKAWKLFGTDQDITSRKEAEQQLHESERALRQERERFWQSQKMEAIGRLAGGISHDFNNCLTVILGEVDAALGHPNVSAEMVPSLLAIQEAGCSAAKLTRQLLTFSRQACSTGESVCINSRILTCQRLLWKLIGGSVKLELDLFGGDCSIPLDRSHVDQILMNLVSNASDAMESGGRIIVRTRLSEFRRLTHDADIPCVELSIIDEGSGFSPEIADRLFEPFFTTKDPGHGTGLGLAVVHGIIDQAGGTMNATSSECGSSFVLNFPIVAPEVGPATGSAPQELPIQQPSPPSSRRAPNGVDGPGCEN